MFSIIMPVYNCKTFLEKSIESVINQDNEQWELIIIDDGSSDGSEAICDRYADKDSRVKVTHIENSGPSTARNIGIEKAQKEYVLFLDSDDLLEKNALSRLCVEVKKNNPELIIYNYFNDRYEYGEVKNVFNRELGNRILNSNDEFKKCYLDLDALYMTYPVWNKLYKKELIERAHAKFPESISVAEDFVYNLRIYGCVSKVITIDEKLYHYIFHPTGSLSQRFDINRLNKYKQVYVKATFFFEKWLPEAINNLSNNYLYEISIYINNMFNKKINLKTHEKKKIVKSIVEDYEIRKCIKTVKCNNKRNKIIKTLVERKSVNMLLLTGKMSRLGK